MAGKLLPFLPPKVTELQSHRPGCRTQCPYGAAPSPVDTLCSPPRPFAHLRLVSIPLLSAPCLTAGLNILLLPCLPSSRLPAPGLHRTRGGLWPGKRGGRTPKGQEEGETMGCRHSWGGELGTRPVELLGAVGGFENVFTHWTHFHFQNSVFLAALIFSLKFYLTVFEIGQCSNLAALM